MFSILKRLFRERLRLVGSIEGTPLYLDRHTKKYFVLIRDEELNKYKDIVTNIVNGRKGLIIQRMGQRWGYHCDPHDYFVEKDVYVKATGKIFINSM